MRLLKRGETIRSSPGTCKRIRLKLIESMHRRLGADAPWVHRHVTGCPRCQRRLAALGRVDLALSVIKSQPHRLDLLMQANACALRMLSHDLREAGAARRLDESRPEPSLLDCFGQRRSAIANIAACLAVLLLSKAGLFSSLDKANTQGQQLMKHYYATHAGEDLAGEVFDTSPADL